MSIGSGDEVEFIQLKNQHTPSNTKRLLIKSNNNKLQYCIWSIKYVLYFRIFVKEVGHFVVVEVPDLGIQIYWDKGTKINLQVDQKWKTHVRYAL